MHRQEQTFQFDVSNPHQLIILLKEISNVGCFLRIDGKTSVTITGPVDRMGQARRAVEGMKPIDAHGDIDDDDHPGTDKAGELPDYEKDEDEVDALLRNDEDDTDGSSDRNRGSGPQVAEEVQDTGKPGSEGNGERSDSPGDETVGS